LFEFKSIENDAVSLELKDAEAAPPEVKVSVGAGTFSVSSPQDVKPIIPAMNK
jgi:hypothetical protein